MLKRIWNGVAGGMVAGSMVGLGEALYILSGANTGEYVALVYAAVLYGVIGAGIGVGVGVGSAILGKLWDKVDDALSWCLGFVGVLTPLGLVIGRYVINKAVYAEQGVPGSTMGILLAALVLNALLDLWLLTVLLRRTPLKFLTQPVGGVVGWLSIVLLAGVFSFAPGTGGDEGMAPARAAGDALADKPDVILVVVDTLRADHLGTYGNNDGLTPNLDDFAQDSVVFEQFITQASWTRASFASLYTSMLPSSHNCVLKAEQLPDDVETLAEQHQAHGYVTGGMPNNINVTKSFNFQQGFDWFEYQSPSYIAGATESAAQLSMYNVLRKARDKAAGDSRRVEDYYQPAESVFVNAKSFVSANREAGNKYLLVVHLMEAHDPYFKHPYDGYAVGRAWHPNPDPSEADELRGLYQGEVKHMDEEVGKFFGWLKEQGAYDDSLVLVTADHGEEFYEHEGWWHGITLYDEQIHVPLLMKLPQGELAGSRVPWQVRQIDVTPTIAGFTGAPKSGLWQGSELLGSEEREALAAIAAHEAAPEAVEDAEEAEVEAAADDVEEAVIPEAPQAPDLAPLQRVAVSEQNFEGNDLGAIRKDGWKYIRANEGNPRGLATDELYNVEADPSEQENLAAQEGPRQAELSALLRDTVEAASAGGVQKQETEISCEECEKLMMLGYMSDCTASCGG